MKITYCDCCNMILSSKNHIEYLPLVTENFGPKYYPVFASRSTHLKVLMLKDIAIDICSTCYYRGLRDYIDGLDVLATEYNMDAKYIKVIPSDHPPHLLEAEKDKNGS